MNREYVIIALERRGGMGDRHSPRIILPVLSISYQDEERFSRGQETVI
jgi:hypothetical protein